MIAAWSPAATPSRVCPSMILAFFDTIVMSANMPAGRPAPTAGPRMAQRSAWSS